MTNRMPKVAASPENNGPQRRERVSKARRGRHSRLFATALVAVTLGLGTTACLSDVAIPDCLQDNTCGGGGSGGSAGQGGSGHPAGGSSAGEVTLNASGSGGELGGTGAGANAGASGETGAGGAEAGAGGEAGTGPSPEPCPNCIAPFTLPPPCGSNPYSLKLTVSRGKPPYTWQITPPVDQWHISADPATPDGSSAKLTGQAAGNSNITVEVSDANGKFAQQIYPVLPRSACWFAYTSLTTAGPQLSLVDPILSPLSPVALPHDPGVYDFHFSPDGQYLAYRYGEDASNPTGAHVALVNLSTLNEDDLNFGEDAVTAFAWSGDASVLAVAFTSGTVSYLGGVRINAAPSTAVTTLTPTPALVQSDLYWVGSNAVAFHAEVSPDPDNPGQLLASPGQLTAFAAPLGSAGFDPPHTFDSVIYFPGVFVQPAGEGFFVISPVDEEITFNWLSSGSGTANSTLQAEFVSPSGAFTAHLDTSNPLSTVQIYGAQKGIPSGILAQSDAAGGCPKLLTWAPGRERIACVADVTSGTSTHGEVRIFDLQSTSTLKSTILPGFCVKDGSAPGCGTLEYDYTEASASLQARAFSPSGRWFAFTAPSVDGNNYLYWADLNSQPPQLKRKLTFVVFGATTTTPTALSFSQDDNYLLYQRGSVLIEKDLRVDQSPGSVSSEPPISTNLPTELSQTTSACSEDFLSAPDRWCGNANRKAPFVWAPDSRFAAYRAGNSVTVVDLTQVVSFESHPLPAPDCSDECQNQFEFQPQTQ
jgi:hypothetical protein